MALINGLCLTWFGDLRSLLACLFDSFSLSLRVILAACFMKSSRLLRYVTINFKNEQEIIIYIFYILLEYFALRKIQILGPNSQLEIIIPSVFME